MLLSMLTLNISMCSFTTLENGWIGKMSFLDVIFKYLPTSDMPVDIMTKALPHTKHEKFMKLLGLHAIKSL